MSRFLLEHLADDSLDDELQSAAEHDCESTACLIARIAEAYRRRHFARSGFSSMNSYCVHKLHLSEDAASKRIQVARKALIFPVIFHAIADGRVHLTGMALLMPFVDEENVEDLIAAATHRSRREIELMLADRFPRPDEEEGVEELPTGAERSSRNRSGVRPLAPGRYLVQFTVTEDQHERLQYALQLMSHRNPTGNLAFLHRTALESLIEELEQEKFGATDDPRDGEGHSSGRHVPEAVKREVWKRDGGRCAFVSAAGRRCESRWQIEYDHELAFARGGEATVDNIRLLCRAHNQYAAECTYGAGFMKEKRARGSDVNFVNAPGHLGVDSHAPGHVVADAPGRLGVDPHAPGHVAVDAPGHLEPDSDAPAHVGLGQGKQRENWAEGPA